MKKSMFFVGFLGLFLVASSAEAEINAATTNTVRQSMYNIRYGTGVAADNDTYGYRNGVDPMTQELETAVGTTPSTTLSNVTVGNLASVSDNSGNVSSAAVDSSHSPTRTVRANTANIDVLKRDKLVVPSANNCDSGEECGYVTISNGGDNGGNNTTAKVWMEIR